ncbi:MAG: hypothetical protein M1817_001146 [Caeruleum heppii]|nr:MAG: hypothetical protein M1817_001146 [Caeruleum heppii]
MPQLVPPTPPATPTRHPSNSSTSSRASSRRRPHHTYASQTDDDKVHTPGPPREKHLHRLTALSDLSLQALAHILCLPISPPPPPVFGREALALHRARQRFVREAIDRLPRELRADGKDRDDLPIRSKIAGALRTASHKLERSGSLPAVMKTPMRAGLGRLIDLEFLHGNTAGLCATHESLRPRLVHTLFTSLIGEVSVRLEPFVLGFPALPLPQQRLVHNLRGLQALWLSPTQYRAKANGLDRWTFQPDRCEACVLARVGADPETVGGLRAVLLSRVKPGRICPRFLRWVEAWIAQLPAEEMLHVSEWSGRIGEEMRRFRDVMREQRRRERRAARRERGDEESSRPSTADGEGCDTDVVDDNDGHDLENQIIDHYATLLSGCHLPLTTDQELNVKYPSGWSLGGAIHGASAVRQQASPFTIQRRSEENGFIYPPLLPSPSSLNFQIHDEHEASSPSRASVTERKGSTARRRVVDDNDDERVMTGPSRYSASVATMDIHPAWREEVRQQRRRENEGSHRGVEEKEEEDFRGARAWWDKNPAVDVDAVPSRSCSTKMSSEASRMKHNDAFGRSTNNATKPTPSHPIHTNHTSPMKPSFRNTSPSPAPARPNHNHNHNPPPSLTPRGNLAPPRPPSSGPDRP